MCISNYSITIHPQPQPLHDGFYSVPNGLWSQARIHYVLLPQMWLLRVCAWHAIYSAEFFAMCLCVLCVVLHIFGKVCVSGNGGAWGVKFMRGHFFFFHF